MKKILFMTTTMGCGGVEKALLNLIDSFPKDEYQIKVLLVEKNGYFMDTLSQKVDVVELPTSKENIHSFRQRTSDQRLYYNLIKSEGIGGVLRKLHRQYIKRDLLYYSAIPLSKMDALKESYDYAICYHMHFPLNIAYIAEKVKAEYKYIWIHNDLSTTGFNAKIYVNYLKNYNAIFAVSEQVKKEFCNMLPELASKAHVFPNEIAENLIRGESVAGYPDEYKDSEGIKILSIGRLTKQKGFDMVPLIMNELVRSGIQAVWYILGDGEEKNTLLQIINENGCQHSVRLLGIRMNPYNYIKNCDIYVQPSRHEGYGIAVAEARVLEKPIICTDFAGAYEQIVPGETGEIVHTDVNELADAIKKLCLDSNIRRRYQDNLAIQNLNSKNKKRTENLITEWFKKE